MSNEIRFPYTSGSTMTFVVRRPSDSKVWYPGGLVWENHGTGGRTNADYDIALTDKLGDYYVGDFPTGITVAGMYDVIFLNNGTFFGSQGIDWDGSARSESGGVALDFIKNVLEGDYKIDITTTPWDLVVYKKGTSTELIRKELKDIAGVNITAITTVIGQQLEP
jgi:hypothetical protein